jgi:hypothetical protein
MTHEIKRNETLIATVHATGVQDKKIMGANIVAMNFELSSQTKFTIGDYADIYGERYYINYAPSEKQHSSIRWEYNLELQAIPYDLIRAKYFGYNASNVLTEPISDLTGTANTFIDLIVANANRNQSGWVKGDVDETETITLQFTDTDNCLSVLSQLAEKFKTEYWIEGKTIHLTKKGEILNTTLSYGQGNGLRSIERIPLDQKPPITRLFVYGSTKNLPANYRDYSRRLKLPTSITSGYLEANVDLYGVREEIYTNEEIYPKREAAITGTNAINSITDTSLDFDLNAQLVPGVSAKVKFISGQLSGYQFEISTYNSAAKTITFNENTDEKAFAVPSETQRPVIGDKYVLFDIIMPETYINAAEALLLSDGQAYLNEHKSSRFNYPITVDPFHFERQSLYLSLGKYIKVVSPEFGLNDNIRIIGYTRDIQKPFNYPSVEVSHSIQFNAAVLADTKQREIEKAIQVNNLNDPQRARNSWKTTSELTTLIETLRAEMLLIVVEGGAYTTNVIATTLTDSFSTTAGIIKHEQYTENGGTWNPTASALSLTENKPYYVYFRSSKSSIASTIVLSTTKIALNDEAGFYHFPFGIVSSIIDGSRFFTSLRGYSRTVAGTISTGRIVSNDGLNYLDLDTKFIKWGDENSGFDFGVTTPGEFTIQNALASKVILVGSEGNVNAGISGITDNGLSSTRFWSGAVQANKDTAPFRVQDDGTASMSKANITGNVNIGTLQGATGEGYTSGWKLSQGAILSDGYSYPSMQGGNNNAIVRGSSRYPGDLYNEFSFGTELIPGTTGGVFSQVGKVTNNRPKIGSIPGFNDTTNIGLEVSASGANKNVALQISKGDLVIKSEATVKVGDNTGVTGEWDVRMGGEVFWKMRWEKGILVSAVKIP